MQPDPEMLVRGIRDRNQQAVALAISIIADRRPGWESLLDAVGKEPRTATFIGITGAPGSGKSTLADAITSFYRAGNRRVGIVAVDPSSPFSGGAILGDRLRMQDHAGDPDVFIRSMASRGRLGGLAPATAETAAILAMAGYDPVIIETVGVGQSEVDVMSVADVVLMVLVPGNGDSIQALKAGVMEIGDLFVLNQADRPGSDRLLAEVNAALRLSGDEDCLSRVFQTVATEGRGVPEVATGIDAFLGSLQSDAEKAASRRERQFLRLVNLAVHDMTDEAFEAYRKSGCAPTEGGTSWSEAVRVATGFLDWLRTRPN